MKRVFRAISAILIFASVAVFPLQTAFADVTADYFVSNQIYNNLISNRDFIDVGSMTESDIQAFLVGKGSYLAQYSEGGRSAANIIYEAARGIEHTVPPYDTWLNETYKDVTLNSSTGTVSPKVLLVMLQKEQSLVTRTTYNETAITIAMGYGCPDSSTCKPQYFGFTNQVEWAAWQLRYNYERAQGKGLDFQVGQTMNNVDGKYNVTFGNAATASVYRYTPHVFDSAFNFYNLYNRWFVPNADVNANDTTPFTLKSYSAGQSISGAKTSDSIAYFNNQQIAGLGSLSWRVDLSNLALGTNSYSVVYKNGGGTTLGSKTITIVVHKPGDINGDNNVDIQDLSTFAAYWGEINPDEPLANLTGVVGHAIDIQDLSILAGYWGK
jgi:hypothetical protein